MRWSIAGLFTGSPVAGTNQSASQSLNHEIEALLAPFHEQSAAVRSIVAIGCHQMFGIPQPTRATGISEEPLLLRLIADEVDILASTLQEPTSPADLESLARRARQLFMPAPAHDLLLVAADRLPELLHPPAGDLSFRAAVVVFPQTSGQHSDEGCWALRRSLFDRGLICIGSVPVGIGKALCFLASDAIRSFKPLDVESRGVVSMSMFHRGAAFANQLFRYSGVKLYALRNGLSAEFPPWQGNELFGLEDKSCAGLALSRLTFKGFATDDRYLWDSENPPINVDLEGYFQELPECWRKHRPFLRSLFQLSPELTQTLDDWRRNVTDGGQRTLVAVHVRRGDYRDYKDQIPFFRLVPEQWYLDWLRAIWPILRNPILFVSTDEPDAIRPVFQEFETISAKALPADPALPEYVRDFEVLRRADYLAMCNSSFSRMASILAPATQKCFLPSFKTGAFAPYEPWIDPAFWERFDRSVSDVRPASTVIDVSDLMMYLLQQSTLSGIQRVECEILRSLLATSLPQPIRLVVLNKRGGLCAIESSALLAVIEEVRSGETPRVEIASRLQAILSNALPWVARPRDLFLTLGAFWNLSGMGLLLQQLKNSGVIIGVFVHDIIPITAPEYFEAATTSTFIKGINEALTFADFILTTSEFNRRSLREQLGAGVDGVPVELVPLAHELSPPADSKISQAVFDILASEYVLCVGTIEVRKNPSYLFNIWKMLARSGRSHIPKLVFAGRKGWLVQDFLDQLKACHYLDGSIVVVHGATDVELNLLYRNCLLTVFPSFVEGWGLPVGESLAHGKICICSGAGGIPDVGGALLDYVDPYNPHEGLARLTRYLDDPELRRTKEREIADHFRPRSWRQTADDFLNKARRLALKTKPMEGVATILLPSGRFMPISSYGPALPMDKIDGRLSAELICTSGWRLPELSGVRPAQPVAAIRFRAAAQPGTRISLVVRLTAHGGEFRVRIVSGQGTETEVSVAKNSEKVAVLPCTVEPAGIVSAQFFTMGATLGGGEFSDASYWMLKGILYFDPKSVTCEAFQPQAGRPPLQPPKELLDRGLIRLPKTTFDDSRRTALLAAFLKTTNCYWSSESISGRNAPVFADTADRSAFFSFCEKNGHSSKAGMGNDSVTLMRRSDQFVSMSRFTEGSVFDLSGVWKGFGYLQGSPAEKAPWLLRGPDGPAVEKRSLAAAPYYEGSYLIFYNGNLHNYYHWLVEGLLCLDVLSGALGLDSNLKIALPKTMEIHAVIDHRETLRSFGVNYDTVEIESKLIRVQEAVWVDEGIVEFLPPQYLKQFQQRMSAFYQAAPKPPGRRRLLVARRGPTRTIQNIAQVQNFLAEYGFETVYLEGLTMADQITLFQGAEFIIGPHGAGLSNLLFCAPGTKVIEFMPAVEMRPFFWIISQKLDLVHGLQFCALAGSQGFQSAITVDINKLQALMHLIDERG